MELISSHILERLNIATQMISITITAIIDIAITAIIDIGHRQNIRLLINKIVIQ